MRTSLALIPTCLLFIGACSSNDTRSGGQDPRAGAFVDQVRFSAVDKADLVFMLDGSPSMADKQAVLAKSVPDLLSRLVTPNCLDGPTVVGTADAGGACPAGSVPEFTAIRDIHIAVVTSNLGGHGADSCVAGGEEFHPDDGGHPVVRLLAGGTVPTYQSQGFLAWDPDQKLTPPGEDSLDTLETNFARLVQGVDHNGCGYASSLEAWYRFLIDPSPPASVTSQSPDGTVATALVTGTDELLLQQRAAFLRPDSLVAVVTVSDENDCSIIDGALPPDVCDSPIFDDRGKPTGCKGGDAARTPWPANYARGNFQGYAVTNGGVTGTPFPANQLAAQQAPVGALSCPSADGQEPRFCLPPGTATCADDPDSPGCRSCLVGDPAGCAPPTADHDPPSLRCWNQKQRFGVDMLYPLQRYIAGLNAKSIYDRDGYLVPNPLFDDLPYDLAKKNGTLSTFGRTRLEARPTNLVFFATIVGVPWQDIARNQGDLASGGSTSPDLKAGYLTATRGANDPPETRTIDWEMILGNPSGHDGEARRDPKDPLMIESNLSTDPAHLRAGQMQPITGETIGAADAGTWNGVNGHEWRPPGGSLPFACLFDLTPDPVTDTYAACPETAGSLATSHNPLCERPVSATDTRGSGTYDDPPRQYRAGAYPGTRFLQVAKSFGTNAIVASICTPNLKNEKDAQGNPSPDFGYRPAVTAIADRFKTQLVGRCLPRTLPTTDGQAPCRVIDAQLLASDGLGSTFANDPAQVAKCQACEGPDRRPLDPAVAAQLTGDVTNYDCLCEIKQFTGPDLTTCQTDTTTSLTSIDGDASKGGWCYVDPDSPGMPDHDAAVEIVSLCPSTQKHTIRFVNTRTQNTTLFISCDTSPVVDAGVGGSGAAGAN